MKLKIKQNFQKVTPEQIDYNGKSFLFLKVKEQNKFNIYFAPKLLTFYNLAETPIIQNYSQYTIFSQETIAPANGCSGVFGSPSYTFPSWSDQIPEGISFGAIQLQYFLNLEGTFTQNKTPNYGLVCS